MTVRERINQAINSSDFSVDSIEKIIAIAYYIGREEATREICDRAHEVFAEQQKRADECRYHEMARKIQGNVNSIYADDYSQEITNAFSNDSTQF